MSFTISTFGAPPVDFGLTACGKPSPAELSFALHKQKNYQSTCYSGEKKSALPRFRTTAYLTAYRRPLHSIDVSSSFGFGSSRDSIRYVRYVRFCEHESGDTKPQFETKLHSV